MASDAKIDPLRRERVSQRAPESVVSVGPRSPTCGVDACPAVAPEPLTWIGQRQSLSTWATADRLCFHRRGRCDQCEQRQGHANSW